MLSPKEKKKLISKLKNAYQVCKDCGSKYGVYSVGCSSSWTGNCDVCGEHKSVTEARDYAYLVTGIRKLTTSGIVENTDTKPKTKYVSKISSIMIENTESTSVDGLTEVFLNDEGAGAYISLKQDTHEITLDPDEIELVYEACKKLLNQ